MDLRHLRYFVAVAEELNFTRAAVRLNIAQPPLSQQIQRLEEELDLVLLIRTKRTVEMTDAGRAFLEEARLTLAQAQRTIDAARRASRGEVGRISLGFVPIADLNILPRILPIFIARYPNVDVAVHCLSSVNQVEYLIAKRIDAGLMVEPIDYGLVNDQGFKSESLFREPFVVVLPASSPYAKYKHLSLRQLVNEKFVLHRRDIAPAYYDNVVMGMFREAGFNPTLSQASDHIQTIVGLVASGLGISLLPHSVTKIGRNEVIYRPLRFPVTYSCTTILYNEVNKNSSLHDFIAIARDCVKGNFV